MIKRICLVQSPIDDWGGKRPYLGIIPPLNLLSLATFIRGKVEGLEIKVVDGDLIGMDAIKKIIADSSSEIVGIAAYSCECYINALEIAKIAKESGAKVIFGGEQASVRAKQIIANQLNVDYVVCGQGEIPLLDILKDVPLHNIQGLVYREGNDIKLNPPGKILLLEKGELPIPDRNFVDLEGYRIKFKKTT